MHLDLGEVFIKNSQIGSVQEDYLPATPYLLPSIW